MKLYISLFCILLLADEGFSCIHLRIFVNPENEKGYSPVKGFCGLEYTKQMARRTKDAGKGTCNWEPLRAMFGTDGVANENLFVYKGISEKYFKVQK